MIGPEDFHDSLLELSTVLLGEETSNSLLQRIVDTTCAAVPGCSHVGMSLANDGHTTTTAATNDTTLQLDGAQYRNGEGPCLQAARTGRSRPRRRHDHRRIASRDSRRKPAGLGINSSLSMPLTVRRRHDRGAQPLRQDTSRPSKNIVNASPSRFARQASATLANAEIHDRTVALVTQLNEALSSRSVIDQARGVLIAGTGCSADEAIDTLKQRSQHENRKRPRHRAPRSCTTP